MSVVKLKAGETVLVTAAKAGEPVGPDQGLPAPQPPTAPVDPGYGIDLGLGWLRPTHPIAPGGPPLAPTHPIYIPPEQPVTPPAIPVDPGYGIDEILGYLRPDNSLPVPPEQPPPEVPGKPGMNWELHTGWTPTTGWVVFATPSGPTPTPSKRK